MTDQDPTHPMFETKDTTYKNIVDRAEVALQLFLEDSKASEYLTNNPHILTKLAAELSQYIRNRVDNPEPVLVALQERLAEVHARLKILNVVSLTARSAEISVAEPSAASPTPASDTLFQSTTWTQFETSAQTKFGNKWDGFKAAVTRIINNTTEPAHKIQALKALKHDEQFKSVLKGTPGERFLNFILHVGAYFKAGFGEKNKENRRDYRHGVQADSTSKFFRPDRKALQAAKEHIRPRPTK